MPQPFWLKFVHVVVADLPRLINGLERLERWLSVRVVVETAVSAASEKAEAPRAQVVGAGLMVESCVVCANTTLDGHRQGIL